MWSFDQPPDAAAILSRSIAKEGRPILFVTHDEEDHGWQFLDGCVPPSEPVIVSMRDAVGLDPSVLELADLPPGGSAWRETARHPWLREQPKTGDL
jgi:hypothetical protein